MRNLIIVLLLSNVCQAQMFRHTNAVKVGVTVSPLLANLNSAWELDETSGNAIDKVAAYNATLNGGITQNVAGKINTCYTFNGTTGYLLGGSIFSSSTFTFAAWVKTSSATIQTIICVTNALNSAPQLVIDGTSGYIAAIRKRGVIEFATSSSGISTGVWQHVAFTYDGGTGAYVFYINGSAVGSGTSVQTFTMDNLVIGSQNGAGGSEWWNGQIDGVRIWNSVLTSTLITELYTKENAGTGYPW